MCGALLCQWVEFSHPDSQFSFLVQQNSVMYRHLTKLVTEKGLDSQNYHCAGCKRPVGISENICMSAIAIVFGVCRGGGGGGWEREYVLVYQSKDTIIN